MWGLARRLRALHRPYLRPCLSSTNHHAPAIGGRWVSPTSSYKSTSALFAAKSYADDGDRTERVRIGHVDVKLGDVNEASKHLIPSNYLPEDPSPMFLQHLQWMMAKDNLSQDMLLVGQPGAGNIYRRRLALAYAELTQREVEYVTLTSDTTESDLKQRRELVSSSTSSLDQKNVNTTTVEFSDQGPVRAARSGRLLILDGLEKVERNVLPTLNNLLENREMHLEDGSFLISPRRFEELSLSLSSSTAAVLDAHDGCAASSTPTLVPVHEDFRVIALAVPAPPYPGRSLDPPLRSRFQIRRVDNLTTSELYEGLFASMSNDVEPTTTILTALDNELRFFTGVAGSMEAMATLGSGRFGKALHFPSTTLSSMATIMRNFPQQDRRELLLRAYPLAVEDERMSQIINSTSEYRESKRTFWNVLGEIEAKSSLSPGTFPYSVDTISPGLRVEGSKQIPDVSMADVSFFSPPIGFTFDGSSPVTVAVPTGKGVVNQQSPNFVQTKASKSVLTAMIQEHSVGRDILLMAPKGEGKNATVRQFATLLGYDNLNLFAMCKEMTSRDLLQRRTTSADTGETRWDESPLVQAAQRGELCILDGVEKLRPDVLASLQRLATDREMSLPDGRHLMSDNRATLHSNSSSDDVVTIPSSFRIVALASLQQETRTSWLTPDVMTMFSTITLPPPRAEAIQLILKTVTPAVPDGTLTKILRLHTALTADVAENCGVAPLSMRNLIRIVRRVEGNSSVDLHNIVCSVLVTNLLPPSQRAALDLLLQKVGIQSVESRAPPEDSVSIDVDKVSIGKFSMKRGRAKRMEMVPSPKFFDVPSHVEVIKDLLEGWSSGERAILLLGNQGVGKNMIVDRICQLANWEREYIQLHRDSTIGQLTLAPSLEDGKVVWRDSPLVRAVNEGCALVIDEADKAPVEVISVLKGLAEDGELLLADGRRISRNQDGPGIIKIHPDFTLWVLANRPGFPFLGNDFFQEVGDCFLTRVIPNPDLQSEINLLCSYAPSVEVAVLRRIAASFGDLRYKSDRGDISHPYSTREAIALVKHLEKYPNDGIVSALHNVLDFDSFDERTYAALGEVFQRHGFAVTDFPSWREALERSHLDPEGTDGLPLQIEYFGGDLASEGKSDSPPSLSQPKRGKWDAKNEAHVGGNQWAGGTGGSDTAGLGGRGGPYRLDRGHRVHQVSEEAKSQVSEDAAASARAIARKALEERLEEIGMSKTEWQMYHRFATGIREDIANLRGVLRSTVTKSEERDWLKRQSHGEIDDSRLVDGVAGDRYIYKRRGVADEGPSNKPRRLRFVLDCSGSMYRFNSYDERLQRCLEAALLIMESFDGLEARYNYSIVGHSGDSSKIDLVGFGDPPSNENERMKVLQTMLAHSQYCQSGDQTLQAIGRAITDAAGNDHDREEECIVIGVSDANLARYGIRPHELGRILEAGDARQVKAYCIFIASFGAEAEDIMESLPVGRGHVCLETGELPRVVRNILTAIA